MLFSDDSSHRKPFLMHEEEKLYPDAGKYKSCRNATAWPLLLRIYRAGHGH